MKQIEVWTQQGPTRVTELARVTHTFGGVEYTYVLHPDPESAGYNKLLRISELGSGFDTLAMAVHPQTKQQLREENTRPARSKRLSQAQLTAATKLAVARILAHRSPQMYRDSVEMATHKRLNWEIEHADR